jgi:hypothetical protein
MTIHSQSASYSQFSALFKKEDPSGIEKSLQRMTRIGVVGKSIPGAVSEILTIAKAAATRF